MKLFMCTGTLDENNEVKKCLGIIENMQTGEITRINTEDLSDKTIKVLLDLSYKKLQREFLQVVEHQKELPKERMQVIEHVSRKDIEK